MRLVLAICLALLCSPGFAEDTAPAGTTPPPQASTSSIVITLGIAGDADRKISVYQCDGRSDDLRVEYIDAAPNFLALVPVEGGTLVFANVIAGSGARYAAGKWIWWTKRASADLYDVTKGANADPVMRCNEKIDTP